MDYKNYTKEDWDILSGWGWSCLLREKPIYAEHCDWNKLSENDWDFLLLKQPRFAKHKPKVGKNN